MKTKHKIENTLNVVRYTAQHPTLPTLDRVTLLSSIARHLSLQFHHIIAYWLCILIASYGRAHAHTVLLSYHNIAVPG